MFLLSEEMNETRPNLLLLFITCTAVRIYVISYHLEVVVGLLFDDSIIILVLMILILVAKKLTKAKLGCFSFFPVMLMFVIGSLIQFVDSL